MDEQTSVSDSTVSEAACKLYRVGDILRPIGKPCSPRVESQCSCETAYDFFYTPRLSWFTVRYLSVFVLLGSVLPIVPQATAEINELSDSQGSPTLELVCKIAA
jgi:hypothetical protein